MRRFALDRKPGRQQARYKEQWQEVERPSYAVPEIAEHVGSDLAEVFFDQAHHLRMPKTSDESQRLVGRSLVARARVLVHERHESLQNAVDDFRSTVRSDG